MSVEALLSYFDRMTNEEIFKVIHRIKNKTLFLKGITEKTLNLTQLESGKIKVNPVETELNNFITSIIKTVRFSSEGSHRINFKGTAGPVKLKIDQQMIKEVINNLLYNSIKYSVPGSLINVGLLENSRQVEIQVADKGIGIPEPDKPKVFDAFHRSSNTTGIYGTGLGLSLAQKFIHLHHGDITFESEENRGTTFFVRLPKK